MNRPYRCAMIEFDLLRNSLPSFFNVKNGQFYELYVCLCLLTWLLLYFSLPFTATGMDNLPSWFLRVGAPAFCKPLAYLFNKSLATSTVPRQWKCASIRPVPKTTSPHNHTDFRPISVTAVLCRILERVIVQQFLYPAILTHPHLCLLKINMPFGLQGQLPQHSLPYCRQ